MTESSGSTPPLPGFPGFPGFPPADMLERMWSMMRLSPFGSALPGGQPGAGFTPSLSTMSDMMAPLTNVEELDKRITDMRAVEQWLKLNLSMLQSAIQALEVQRATLATLRAFGAFAQASMSQPQSAAPAPAPAPAPSGWPHPETPRADTAAAHSASQAGKTDDAGEAGTTGDASAASDTPPFDASAWWNLLQSQFNQIAQFAMTQPGATAGDPQDGAASSSATKSAADASTASSASSADSAASDTGRADAAPKQPAARRASAAAPTTKRAGASSGATRATKKTP